MSNRLKQKRIKVTTVTLFLVGEWVAMLYCLPQAKWQVYTTHPLLAVLLFVAGGIVWYFMLKANWPKAKRQVPQDRISQLYRAEIKAYHSLPDMGMDLPEQKKEIEIMSFMK